METGLSQIAHLVEGKIVGNPNLRIRGVNTIDDATDGEITFITSPQYYKKALTTGASVILSEETISNVAKTFLLVKNPRLAMVHVVNYFHPPQRPSAVLTRAPLSVRMLFLEKGSLSARMLSSRIALKLATMFNFILALSSVTDRRSVTSPFFIQT